ncbi:MAG: hypothetical protein U1F43_17110 [Myxococcota bacterium]
MSRTPSAALGALAVSAVIAVIACEAPARAVVGVLDPVPAATLLVPLFEVALDDSQANDTLIALASADDLPVLARVTLWSQRGVAVYAFDVAVPAAGLASIGMGALLRDGQLPVTDVSAFPDCEAAPTTLAPAELARVRAALTGQPDATSGLCSSDARGDQHARGYATIDVMAACTPLYPDEPGYFGAGVDATDNRLIGDVRQVNPYRHTAVDEAAVPLEASAVDPLTSGAGAYTFYGALVGWDGSDHRESLPSRWNATFEDRGDTELVVWRDPKRRVVPYACATPPEPLASGQVVAVEETSHVRDISGWTRLPMVAQAVRIDAPELPSPFRAGYLRLGLDTVASGAPGEPASEQVYVATRGRAQRCDDDPRYRIALPGLAVDDMTFDLPDIFGVPTEPLP